VSSRKRSGSEIRRRTDSVSLRLLPAESAVLRAIAQDRGHRSVQALILHALQPLLIGLPPGDEPNGALSPPAMHPLDRDRIRQVDR
jgi:hypothetical protein